MIRRGYVAGVVAPVLLALFAGVAWSGEFVREFSFATDNLKVVNMIGAIQVTEASGDEFQIQVMVRGEDATADFLEFDTLDSDGEVLAIRYPLKKHKKYV